jgi:CHASE1-domain containing sensor protein
MYSARKLKLLGSQWDFRFLLLRVYNSESGMQVQVMLAKKQ